MTTNLSLELQNAASMNTEPSNEAVEASGKKQTRLRGQKGVGDIRKREVTTVGGYLESGDTQEDERLNRYTFAGNELAENLKSVDAAAKPLESLYQHCDFQPVEVGFSNLSYEVDVPLEDPGIHTLPKACGDILNGLICNAFGEAKSKKKMILKNVSGLLKPGTSTLVLGPRGSGITSLFKSLSGHMSKKSRVSGDIIYSGTPISQIDPKKFATYVAQDDLHVPTLTVRETLDFAAKCFGEKKMLSEYVNLILNVLGITKCQNTFIGNENIRGISGGEKKRVSIGEMLCARKPLAFFDQLSTGLDSATAFKIVSNLTETAKSHNLTFVFSLLQPSPELFDLFDQVIIMADGNFLYHGAPKDVVNFFGSIGYHCPDKVDVPAFIQEVSTDLRINFRDTKAESVPETNEDIASLFLQSNYNKHNPSSAEGPKLKLNGKKFSTGIFKDFGLIFQIQYRLYYRDKSWIRIKILQALILGILLGTVFYDLDSDLSVLANVQQRYALMYFLVSQSMLSAIAFVPNVMENRGVFYKQTRSYFHRVSTYSIASVLVTIPVQIIESVIVTAPAFWISGVIPIDHEDILISFLEIQFFIILLNLVSTSFFQFIGCVASTLPVGYTAAGLFVALMTLFSGIIITSDNITSWFLWVYLVNPLAHTLKVVLFIVLKSPGFPDSQSKLAFELFAFPDDPELVFQAGVFLMACIVLNFFLISFALSYVRHEHFERKREVEADPTPETTIEFGHRLLETNQFTPASLVFKNISYTVSKRKQELLLLDEISGYALPGTMTALMGSSGAGKTTLLDILAGRKTQGRLEGEIYINGTLKNSSFPRMMGYVEQVDVHSPFQTVEESIYFSAKLRQTHSRTEAQLRAFVNNIVETLELGGIRNFMVGNKELGGLTTDEAKRLTIGVELASNPSLLFLDEPTTSLDSRAAQVIMSCIQRLAQSGRTIICTIHQPNRIVFELFDRVLLLQNGGTSVYFGDIGESCESLVTFLESIPGSRKLLNEKLNPADYMLQVVEDATSGYKENSTRTVINLLDYYTNSQLNADNEDKLGEIIDATKNGEFVYIKSGCIKSYWTQQTVLLKKVFSTYWRYPAYTLIRQLFLTIVSIIWGLTVFQVADTNDDFSQTNIFSLMAVFIICITFLGGAAGTFSITSVTHEKGPFMREKAAGVYGSVPYLISWTVVELSYVFVSTATFAATLLFMMGLNPSPLTLFKWWLPFFLSFTGYTFLGQLFMILLQSEDVVSMVISLISTVAALFSGFFIALEDIVPFWSWVPYCLHVPYAVNAMMSAIFACDCTTEDILLQNCQNDNDFGCVVLEIPGGRNITAWDTIIEIYGFDDSTYWDDIFFLGMFVIFYRLLTLVAYVRLKAKR